MQQRQKWTNPDVLEFCQRTGHADPVEAIKERARQLVAQAQIQGPPFSPFLLGEFQRVRRVEFRPIGFDACLIPIEGGFEVHICKDHSEARRNFSMAHELGHILMMDPERAPTTARRETIINSKATQEEEERLCDIAASELLMPSPYFERDVHALGPSLSGVLELSRIYRTSIAATVRRFVASRIWKCFFLVWKVTDVGQRASLKLDQLVAGKMRLADKGAVSLRDQNGVLTALKGPGIVSGREWLRIDDIVEDRFYLETVRIGSRAKPRLLSMVITEPAAGIWTAPRRRRSQQITLFER